MNHLHVDLAHQRVNVIANDGSLLRSMPASTGANGRTPRGTYAVYSKSPWTTASGNGSVSMQWMTRFRGGIGFHAIPRQNGRPLATPLGIAPVSHGCVRLADDDAAWLYHSVPVGMRVVVK
jgi:lipoprotein-anchoring transpeptidase ErfK/SrfK